MNLKLKHSKLMSNNASPLGSVEDRLIRIPKNLREELGFEVGSFLQFRSANNKKIFLQITHAYRQDTESNDGVAYVSHDTFDKVDATQVSSVTKAEDILIGCDPEFFLIDMISKNTISASNFFPHYGEIGADCGLAELRPRPCLDPESLMYNLHTLMRNAYKHIELRSMYKQRLIKMMAFSNVNNASAGFHIHLGLPNPLLVSGPNNRLMLNRIVDILDYYVGIPSIMPEGDEDYKRRCSKYSQYGKPNDYRSNWRTLEYRVPGGHLLRHPLLSEGILSISSLVINDILSRFNAYSNGFKNIGRLVEYKNLKYLYPKLPSKESIYDAIVSEDTKNAMFHIDKIIYDLTKMINYKNRSETILKYFNYIVIHMNHGQKFNESIELNWRLAENEGQQRQMAIF